MLKFFLSVGRRVRTRLKVLLSMKIRSVGNDLHIGAGSRFWAPEAIHIGNGVYIGKKVLVECNADIGDYVLISNRVALVGRHDHDFRTVGVPVRFSPWIGSSMHHNTFRKEKIVVESDVWIGFGAIVLSGVTIGRGAIVAAGSVIAKDVGDYQIVAGNPANIVGMRFKDESSIKKHEELIKLGSFISSERGYDHWVVKTGIDLASKKNVK